MTLDTVLDSEFPNNDTQAKTIRQYLYLLLKTMWDEGESFSGKRPFGNSGWQFDLYTCLIKKGFIAGKLDSDGFIEDYNEKEANAFVQSLIQHMCGVDRF